MHSTEYTARIKALIHAKDKAEENMKRVLFQFRNGRTPNPADVTDARNYWAEALAVLDPEDAANDAELRRDLADQLEEVRRGGGVRETAEATMNALNTALGLLGIEGIEN